MSLDRDSGASHSTGGRDLSNLLSLSDIMLKQANINTRGDSLVASKDVVESYAMRPALTEGENGGGGDRTIIVKRMDLTFNERECQLLNFTDITTYKQLKQ